MGNDIEEQPKTGEKVPSQPPHPTVDNAKGEVTPLQTNKLARRLSARQVSMIAIGGTIGTGLFLGTGKSLATGGPASMLLSYVICGGIIFVTMLCLGEMSAFIPVSGSFCSYAGRSVDDALAFALTWNYWFNDAVSTASDTLALQLLMEFWTDNCPGWAISLIFLLLIIGFNLFSVRVYGEVQYWLSLLKIVAIIAFILVGIAVNCGANTERKYIGDQYWHLGEAPFVGGIGGFASVFVTASFAYGGTESIAVTAGETKDAAKVIPRVVKNVFWRILLFYVLSIIIVGFDVPYNYPNLDEKTSRASPFTVVFDKVGSSVAGSFMNAVIFTSALSAANHALFVGSRLLYTLALEGHAPRVFAKLNRFQIPWLAVLGTSVISGLCFGASYIGAGQLSIIFTTPILFILNMGLTCRLNSIVGVSNQVSWAIIGITSLRFRAAVRKQNLEHLLPFKNWTYPYGPILTIILNIVLILVQGWTSFSPMFKVVDFLSFYVQIPILLAMLLGWKLFKSTKIVQLGQMDLVTDRYDLVDDGVDWQGREDGAAGLGDDGNRKKWVKRAKQYVGYVF